MHINVLSHIHKQLLLLELLIVISVRGQVKKGR